VHNIIQHVEYSMKMARVKKLRRSLGELAFANGHE
jgi:hypothetical protein